MQKQDPLNVLKQSWDEVLDAGERIVNGIVRGGLKFFELVKRIADSSLERLGGLVFGGVALAAGGMALPYVTTNGAIALIGWSVAVTGGSLAAIGVGVLGVRLITSLKAKRRLRRVQKEIDRLEESLAKAVERGDEQLVKVLSDALAEVFKKWTDLLIGDIQAIRKDHGDEISEAEVVLVPGAEETLRLADGINQCHLGVVVEPATESEDVWKD